MLTRIMALKFAKKFDNCKTLPLGKKFKTHGGFGRVIEEASKKAKCYAKIW